MKKYFSKIEVWHFTTLRDPPLPPVWQKTTLFPDFFPGTLPLSLAFKYHNLCISLLKVGTSIRLTVNSHATPDASQFRGFSPVEAEALVRQKLKARHQMILHKIVLI